MLRSLVGCVGAEHICAGSDNSYEICDYNPVEFIQALGLSSEDNAKILEGNARRVLGLQD